MKNSNVTCLVLAVIAFCFHSCDNKKERALHELKNIIGHQVNMPDDSLFCDERAKILILVKDTGDCSPCSMGINEWYVYRLDMEDRELSADVIFVLPECIRLPKEVDSTLLQYGLERYYGYETFIKQNSFLEQTSYSTFLISSEREVKLVGSPLDSPKLWKVYRKSLGEKTD